MIQEIEFTFRLSLQIDIFVIIFRPLIPVKRSMGIKQVFTFSSQRCLSVMIKHTEKFIKRSLLNILKIGKVQFSIGKLNTSLTAVK